MTVAEAMRKMILLSDANFHDINHFLKVHAYALTIGACEGLSQAQRYTLELAAIVHDIACPLCREKYGNTNGKYQEQEGAPLTRAFFEGTDVPSDTVERVVWLVAHHTRFARLTASTTRFWSKRIIWSTPRKAAWRKRTSAIWARRFSKPELGSNYCKASIFPINAQNPRPVYTGRGFVHISLRPSSARSSVTSSAYSS